MWWCSTSAAAGSRGRPEWLKSIYQCGYASVGLFFVLSGFVLAYNYLGPDGRMTAEPRAFWAARIARVYPVYALALVLLAPHVIAGSLAANTVGTAAAKLAVGGGSALLLVHAWLPPATLYWNPPGWSVAVEAFFYAVFPSAAAWVGRVRRERLGWTLVALWGLGLLPSLLYLAFDPDGGGLAAVESRGTWLTVLKFNPVLRLPEFLIGVVLGRLFLLEEPARGRSGTLMATSGGAADAWGLRVQRAPALRRCCTTRCWLRRTRCWCMGWRAGEGLWGGCSPGRSSPSSGRPATRSIILQHPVWLAVGSVAEALAPWVDLRAQRPLFVVYLPVVIGASVLCHRHVETPLRTWVRRVLQPWVERSGRAARGGAGGNASGLRAQRARPQAILPSSVW